MGLRSPTRGLQPHFDKGADAWELLGFLCMCDRAAMDGQAQGSQGSSRVRRCSVMDAHDDSAVAYSL